MTNEASGYQEEAGSAQSLEDQWGAALSEQVSTEEVQGGPAAAKAAGPRKDEVKKPDARPASFGTLTNEENVGAVGNLGMILDIPVTVSVEIGRARMMIKNLLQLGQGSVVELEKLAGEALEIFVNGHLIAKGEAVVINEKFGIKLTDIVSPSERINKLK